MENHSFSLFVLLIWTLLAARGCAALRQLFDVQRGNQCVNGSKEVSEAILEFPLARNVTVCLNSSQRCVLLPCVVLFVALSVSRPSASRQTLRGYKQSAIECCDMHRYRPGTLLLPSVAGRCVCEASASGRAQDWHTVAPN